LITATVFMTTVLMTTVLMSTGRAPTTTPGMIMNTTLRARSRTELCQPLSTAG
jgi:hypothetical protein